MSYFKQELKSNSMLEIFVQKFPCCRKIREALVDYGLKRHLVYYTYAASWVVTIWLAAAIKANHEQLLLWRESLYESCRPEPFVWRYCAKGCSEKFCKIHVKHLCRSLFFDKAAGYYVRTPFFMGYIRTTASSRYPPEELFRKFLKNSSGNTLKESLFLK